MAELDLDRFRNLYASRTEVMRSSDIRNLLDVATRPGIISFAGGLPNLKLLDYEEIELIVRRLINGNGCLTLQYGSTSGYQPLKRSISEVMAAEGMEISETQILITDGGQQALDLISKVFIDPGDVVFTEVPAYTGALAAFNSYQADIVGIPMDEDGLQTEALEEEIRRTRKENKRAKLIYTVPNFSNPSGFTLSFERRKKLLEIARQNGLLVIEDNPYGLLRFEGEPIPSLLSMDQETVIYVGTLSKIFAPGLRVGWVFAPPPIIRKLEPAKQSSDLCSSSLTQMIAHEYLSTARWKENIDKFIEKYRCNRDTMLEALKNELPAGCRWSRPRGGFYIWLRLPDGVDSTDLLAECIENGVAFVPGRAFYPEESGANSLRLAFCTPEPRQIAQGVKVLGQIIKERISLIESVIGRRKKEKRGH